MQFIDKFFEFLPIWMESRPPIAANKNIYHKFYAYKNLNYKL